MTIKETAMKNIISILGVSLILIAVTDPCDARQRRGRRQRAAETRSVVYVLQQACGDSSSVRHESQRTEVIRVKQPKRDQRPGWLRRLTNRGRGHRRDLVVQRRDSRSNRRQWRDDQRSRSMVVCQQPRRERRRPLRIKIKFSW